MRPSSSPSDPRGAPFGGLFGPLSGGQRADGQLGDAAWLAAMLDAERALALACGRAGVIGEDAAAAIAARCDPALFDAAELGLAATAAGNPVVPLVRRLTSLVPDFAAAHVHNGATSQDIVDTAASLVARRALKPIRDDLAAAATTCADLAQAHRGTLMVARTLLQQALPTTFGLVSARWLTALDDAADGLARVTDRLAVQLGGAAGTLAALGSAGPAVARLMAAELGLAEPALPWHTDRTRFAELAAAAGVAAGTLGTIARDVVLLAQTEVGEVREANSGGSSAMPHKQNPVSAVLVSAAVHRIPGLVATALGAMVQEHERAAGTWHAEWETYTTLLHLLGGAADRVRELLGGLEIDTDRMRHNLGRTGGMILAEPVAAALAGSLGRTAAHDLVAEVCAHTAGLPLRDALLRDPRVTEHLTADRIDAALDPASYLGATGELVDRALADHRKRVLR